MSSNQFRVWLNNEYLPKHPECFWIKEAYSKAVTQAVNNGQAAFIRFFKHQSSFPRFKKKNRSDVKMYFVKNNPKDCRCQRHRINIPSLGWVRIKEKGYIPTTKDGYVIKSGHVSIKAGRYYVSALVEIPNNKIANSFNEGIGIDPVSYTHLGNYPIRYADRSRSGVLLLECGFLQESWKQAAGLPHQKESVHLRS